MMDIQLKAATKTDIMFLREMLYEAVFWGAGDDKPTLEEGLAYPDVLSAQANWCDREGDTAVIATVGTNQVGAVWFRFWTDDNKTRGYINSDIPVLGIGVHHAFRRQTIGKKMIAYLIDIASRNGIKKISLCVTKTNHAFHLYKQQGFQIYADIGESFIMVHNI